MLLSMSNLLCARCVSGRNVFWQSQARLVRLILVPNECADVLSLLPARMARRAALQVLREGLLREQQELSRFGWRPVE